MANVLEFALGLETSKFISELGIASAGVLGLAGVAETLEKVWGKVDGTIEKAAGLQTLHARTGETVQTLYELQKGFKAVGLDGSSMPTFLLRIQKTLGGVNEMGERTDGVLSALGLDMKHLADASAVEQVTALTAALGKMPKSQATAVASQLFSRFGAGDLLQIARQQTHFEAAVKSGQKYADIWAALAPAAHEFEVTLGIIKGKMDIIWAQVASALLPAFVEVANWVKQIDLGKLAKQIGSIVSGIVEAIKEGKLTELLELSFAAGVEFFVNMITGTLGSGDFWAGIFKSMAGSFVTQWGVILKMFLSLGDVLLAMFDTVFQNVYEYIGKIPKVGNMLGLEGYTAGTFKNNFAERRSEASGANSMLDGMLKTGLGLSLSGAGSIKDALAKAFAGANGPASDRLKNFIADLAAKAPKLKPESEAAASGKNIDLTTSNYKPEFTSLEKMGFVMSGTANPMADFAKRTANATEQLVKLMGRLAGNEKADTSTLSAINAL